LFFIAESFGSNIKDSSKFCKFCKCELFFVLNSFEVQKEILQHLLKDDSDGLSKVEFSSKFEYKFNRWDLVTVWVLELSLREGLM